MAALLEYGKTRPGRNIPGKAADRILLATWNIANLGVQERREEDYRLLAGLISWFDLVAVQEVNDNLAGLRSTYKHLPQNFHMLFSDAAGNKERLAFLYDADKIRLLEKVGEVAIQPSDAGNVKLPGIGQKFEGFDRNPYFAGFQAGSFTFLLVNVHLYFGSDSSASKNRRSLETYAVARWADNRRKSEFAFTKDIIALGDFNMPKAKPGDPIYEALTKRGLHLPKHSTEIGSAIATDSHYDQIAFFPGTTQNRFTANSGVFDYDGAIFKTLWTTRGRKSFLEYVRYYVSDHRILWAEFRA